ncbi:MAG: hypothetical protein IJ555_06840, partial [Ruminococcus sp.]|nr:hypothetical protein [Ruminococcus sp.]
MKILELTKDQAMWLRYLDFSANLYAYRPSEKLIIFGKNPLAENVATYEQWKKLGRYVKRGEKGIRINAGTVVFDESQTNGKPINKWQFSSDYLDNFCDYINSKGLSETLLTADEEFDLSLYDHISDAMQHNSSISGRIPDKVRELAALSAAYTVTRRLGLSCSSLDLDLSAVEDLTQYETEILVQVSSMYSDRLIAAGRYVLQNTGPRSRQTVSLRSSKDEEPAVVIEDVEEIAEGPHEEETESQENAEEKTEDPKNPYDAQSVTNDEEPYIQDTAQSISLNEDTQTVEMRAVSEKDFSSLLEEEKMRMLDEVLGYSTDAVDKEKVRKYYLENTDISLSDYTRVIYLNKHHRTNNTDYPCITSFSGKNSGLRINYQSDESIESRGYILIDWSTVSKHIRKLINNNEFIVNDKSDDGEKVTSEPKFYVGIDLNSSSDGVSTHIGEFGKETDSYVFGTYPDYDTASGALSQLRARIYSGEDISDIYENLTFREKEIRRSMSFYLNGKEYVVYDCSQMENFVDYTEPENIDPQLSFIMSNENNKPPVIRVGYQQFNDY